MHSQELSRVRSPAASLVGTALLVASLGTCQAGSESPPLSATGSELLLPISSRVAPTDVRTVHLVLSHHLDVGLDLPLKTTVDCVGYATKIVQRYFDDFIPRILRLADELSRVNKTNGFAYQIHAWIAALYVDCVPWRVLDDCPANPGLLRCPSTADVARFDEAVRAGHIVYTHSPFNIDAQAVGDPVLFEDLVKDIAGSLDQRYGRTAGARVWSNVDVKGFARSTIPLLRAAGVSVLSIGQNGHPSNDHGHHSRGMQPAVGGSNATIFRWRDPRSDQEIIVLYHDGYGGPFLEPVAEYTYAADDCIISPNGVALASYFRSDNSGPPDSVDEVMHVVESTKKIFPNAEVVFSSFDDFADSALPSSVTAKLPVFDQDWGDQWLTGMATDPTRLAEYRAVMRSRSACIRANHTECARHSPIMKNVTRWLAKFAEHTQGAQGEQWNPGVSGLTAHSKGGGDTKHWSNEEFWKVHNAHNNKWESGELTWLEARIFSKLAIAAIPDGTAWKQDLQSRLQAMQTQPPDTNGNGLRPEDVPSHGQVKNFECGGMHVAVDNSAALTSLRLAEGAHDWATKISPLLKLSYVTYNKLESWDAKINLTCSEPGCANPQDRVWHASMTGLWHNTSTTLPQGTTPLTCVVLARSEFDSLIHTDAGAPAAVWTRYTLNPGMRTATAEILWVNKTTTRLPESLMLDLRPTELANYSWGMDVLGELVRINETAAGTTNQWQRGIWRGVQYASDFGLSSSDGLSIESYDAAMVCPIVKSTHPMYDRLLGGSTPMGEGIDNTPIELEQVAGIAFNLFNNLMPISGFAQWFPFGTGDWFQQSDENSLFRFVLHDQPGLHNSARW